MHTFTLRAINDTDASTEFFPLKRLKMSVSVDVNESMSTNLSLLGSILVFSPHFSTKSFPTYCQYYILRWAEHIHKGHKGQERERNANYRSNPCQREHPGRTDLSGTKLDDRHAPYRLHHLSYIDISLNQNTGPCNKLKFAFGVHENTHKTQTYSRPETE